MATIYLAARYSRREELCGYKEELERRGHKVPARWLLGEHQAHGLEAARAVQCDGPIPSEQAVHFANDDVDDIWDSDIMINFTEHPRTSASRGGRHIEYGIHLALKWSDPARRLFIVGPLENVFHTLEDVDGRFHDFAGFLAALDDGRVNL